MDPIPESCLPACWEPGAGGWGAFEWQGASFISVAHASRSKRPFMADLEWPNRVSRAASPAPDRGSCPVRRRGDCSGRSSATTALSALCTLSLSSLSLSPICMIYVYVLYGPTECAINGTVSPRGGHYRQYLMAVSIMGEPGREGASRTNASPNIVSPIPPRYRYVRGGGRRDPGP